MKQLRRAQAHALRAWVRDNLHDGEGLLELCNAAATNHGGRRRWWVRHVAPYHRTFLHEFRRVDHPTVRFACVEQSVRVRQLYSQGETIGQRSMVGGAYFRLRVEPLTPAAELAMRAPTTRQVSVTDAMADADALAASWLAREAADQGGGDV